MAASTELNIWVKLKDDASKAVEGIKGKIESMEPTFKKMAVAGGVAFAGITAFAGSAVKSYIADSKDMALANQILDKSLNLMSDSGFAKLKTAAGEGTNALDYLKGKMKEAGDAAIQLGYDDEAASIAYAKLFQVTGDAATAQSELKLAMDLAAYSGRDLDSSVQALTMVHAGGTKVLKEFGLEVKDGTTALDAMALVQARVGGTAEVMAQGMDKQLDIMRLRFDNIKSSIGEAMATALIPLLEKVTPLVEKFVQWAEENPKLLATIIAVVGAIAGLVAIVGTLGLLLPGIIAGFTLLAGPVGIIIAIIGTLIFTVTKLIKIYEMLRDDGALIWEGIKLYMKEAAQWIYDNSIGKLIGWIEDVKQKLQQLWETAKSVVSNIGQKIGNAASSIGGVFTNRDIGGPVTAGRPYIVGEHGPEVFVPGANGRINAGIGGGAINILITDNSFIGEKDLARRVGNELANIVKFNSFQ